MAKLQQLMETTTKASAHASAGSHDGQLAHKTFVPHRDSVAVPSEKMTDSQKKGATSSFRKFREALMAKKFENDDNVPVEVDVVSGLFIGSYGAACNFQALKGAGITHILCVSPSLSLKFLEDFTYLQLQVADLSSVNISEYFDEALSFIDSALSSGGKVLVHCFMGISRSSTIVLAYLIARQSLTLPDALRELRRVRPQVKPNSGFYQELVAFDKEIHNKKI
ncbi:Dual specificity protein phosphatase 1 [Phytophthora citrophthora]|uniref:protein-tyrosine-phosphatase n=1 Tax=Phytophthora citrophthora TaxID=4793 RepID=A0AAD9G8C0_9STRA|nr:Dual specificity protein phosphatase 1 [Phytophthora citrophthora]